MKVFIVFNPQGVVGMARIWGICRTKRGAEALAKEHYGAQIKETALRD